MMNNDRQGTSIILVALSLGVFFGLGVFRTPVRSAELGVSVPIESLAELNRKHLGVISGTSLDLLADAALDFTQIEYYDSPEQQVEALMAGEIDAIIDDLPCNMHLVEGNPELRLLPGVLLEDRYAFGMRQSKPELYDSVNAELKAILSSGLMRDIEARWTGGTPAERVMPKLAEHDSGRIIRYGYSPISAPFCYEGPEGEPLGLEVELVRRITARLGFRLRLVPMEFHEMVPNLLADRVDIIGSCLSVTPERESVLRFTESYFTGGVSAVVLRDPAASRGNRP